MSLPPLPRFGMGTAGIGNLYAAVAEAEAIATVAAALAAGFRYFDTAPFYGFGCAERRLGDALSAHDRDTGIIVSTKVGRVLVEAPDAARERYGFVGGDPFEPMFDYSRDGVLRSYEDSLRRLRRQRAEILLAHDLGARTHGAEAGRHMAEFLRGGYPAMAELRARGAVDAIGIGVNETDVAEYLLERVDLDVILLAGRYTLLDQRAAERLLPACATKGVRVILGGPYNSGILARSEPKRQGARYDYEAAPAPIVARAEAIEKVCAGFGVSLPAAALHFPLRHPAVACIIPGMVGKAQVRDAVARLGANVPEPLWHALADAGLVCAAVPEAVRA